MSLERVPIRQQVRDGLVRAIISGKYKAGDRLFELQVAEEFGVSQAPVREAIRDLEAQGVLETVPYKGTHVRAIDLSAMEQSFEVRASLEVLSVEAALKRGVTDWAAAEGAIAQLVAAARDRSIEAYFEADSYFHRALAASGGNGVLLRVWDSLGLSIRVSVAIQMHDGSNMSAVEDHQAILREIKAGNAKGAGDKIRSHYEAILNIIRRHHAG